jgi:hypothetical protein
MTIQSMMTTMSPKLNNYHDAHLVLPWLSLAYRSMTYHCYSYDDVVAIDGGYVVQLGRVLGVDLDYRGDRDHRQLDLLLRLDNLPSLEVLEVCHHQYRMRQHQEGKNKLMLPVCLLKGEGIVDAVVRLMLLSSLMMLSSLGLRRRTMEGHQPLPQLTIH